MERFTKFNRLLIPLFFYLASLSVHSKTPLKPLSASQDSNLVTIKSYYPDQLDPNKRIEIQGSGFLVEADRRIFVLTASHVSRGAETQLIWKQQNLTIVGRWFDGIGDMEVIEVQGQQLTSSFQYDGKLIKWNGTDIGRSRKVDAFDFILLNLWVNDPNLEVDNQAQGLNQSAIDCDLNCELLTAKTLVQPGASGSPLVMKIPTASEWSLNILKIDWREKLTSASEGTYVLRGMAIRRERFYARSSFVPAWRLTALLQQYLNNKRTTDSRSGWQIAETLLYRIFNGIQESKVIAASSGNGVSMDGGDGLASFSEDEPHRLLANISPFPVGGPWITNWWALKMEDSQANLIVYPIWFDMEHYAPNYVDTLPIHPSSETSSSTFYMQMIRVRFSDPAPGSTFTSQDGKSNLNFTADKINLQIQAANGEKIIFSLDERGAVCTGTKCASKFLPVIEVAGNLGNTYLIDLRGFYLMNASLVISDLFKNPSLMSMSSADIDSLKIRVLNDDFSKVRILYRKKRASSDPMTVAEGSPATVVWISPGNF